jgi:hypothetical protein
MKQEMKNYLLQSVQELKLQRKSQEESINILFIVASYT